MRADLFKYLLVYSRGHEKNVGRTFHYVKSHYYIENIDTYNKIRNLQNMDKDISFYIFVPKRKNSEGNGTTSIG